MCAVTVTKGFDPSERETIARLYWEAFGGKLAKFMQPERRAIAFFEAILNPDFAYVARDGDDILGVAGFKTKEGALTDGGFADLARFYGWSGVWRGPLLLLLVKHLEPDVLTMDGIFVTEAARGRGVGTALLGAIRQEAEAQGKSRIRLEVIDTNPRARALYERLGFVQDGQRNLSLLRRLYGFEIMQRMILDCRNAAN